MLYGVPVEGPSGCPRGPREQEVAMGEEHVREIPPKRKSPLPKLLLLAGLMLVVAVVVNLKDIRAIASGRRTVKSVLYGKNLLPSGPSFSFPDPLGPQDAKVKVKVVAQDGNSCHEPLVVLWMAVASLEPERLRVEFGSGMVSTPEAEAAKAKGESKEGKAPGPPELGCEAGVLINGQNKFEVGSGKSKRVIYLTGPTSGPMANSGQPGGDVGHGWSLADVAAIVNQAIAKAYKQKGNLTV